jgi:uncharacterized repeat protein (TIGR01451 family)
MASPATGPALSIHIDDGRTAVATGDRITYTVTVRNIGSTHARLDVGQTLPAGLSLVSADRGGTFARGQVSWRLELPAGRDSSFRAEVRVHEVPPTSQRLAAVACATLSGTRRPIVCASDSDRLPVAAASPRSGPTSDGGRWQWVAPAGGAVACAAIVAVFWRLVRRRGLSRSR